MLLLGSMVHVFAQNKLPDFECPTIAGRMVTMALRAHKQMTYFRRHPIDLKSRVCDSLYEKWRSHELVQDDEHPTKYLIIITLDGMRWQEVFTGADSILWQETTTKTRPEENFWHTSGEKRREQLLPFLWNEVAEYGQIYGNRFKGSSVSVTNRMRISYPGYNEIFTGHPDDRHIKLNFKIPNPNPNVLRFIGERKNFRGRVASFASWDVFPSILNAKQGGIYVNAAFEPVRKNCFFSLNAQLETVSKPWGNRVRPDSLTTAYALQYLSLNQPRVLHLGLGETDEYAHEKKYAEYLEAAHASDRMIRQIWEFVQSSPVYRNKTTLFITTDHGRGNDAATWHKHHTWVDGAEEIWFAVMGPETLPSGEIQSSSPQFQNQFAQTFAAFLGLDYLPSEAIGEKITALLGSGNHPITQR
mgnify:CR=1 FL=1